VRVLSFDPGSKYTAWAMLEQLPGEAVRVVSYDTCDSTYARFEKLIRNGDLVWIERIKGYSFQPFRTKYLIETARAEGRIEGAALANGNTIDFVSAGEWRKHFLGKANAGDDLVKEFVLARFPNLLRSNEHTRDAICVGLYGMETCLTKSNSRSSSGSRSKPVDVTPSSRSSAKPGKKSTVARTS
jgi:Holliday junction resolvasome RuvABC endonuclease subunit